jgi:hypothetical protein
VPGDFKRATEGLEKSEGARRADKMEECATSPQEYLDERGD